MTRCSFPGTYPAPSCWLNEDNGIRYEQRPQTHRWNQAMAALGVDNALCVAVAVLPCAVRHHPEDQLRGPDRGLAAVLSADRLGGLRVGSDPRIAGQLPLPVP